MSADDFTTAHQNWAADRLAALKAGNGWLNLTDRIETGPGRHTVGHAEGNDLRLAVGPDHLGVLEIAADGSASLDTGSGAQPFVASPDTPPQLASDGLLLEITSLEGQQALRVHRGSVDEGEDQAARGLFELGDAERAQLLLETDEGEQGLRLGGRRP